MSDLHFLLVWAKLCKTWLVCSDGIVVDVVNASKKSEILFLFYSYFSLSSRSVSVMLIAERFNSELWQ